MKRVFKEKFSCTLRRWLFCERGAALEEETQNFHPALTEGSLCLCLLPTINYSSFLARSRGIGFDEIGKERYMPTDLVMVPIMVNLMLIFGFIFMGAILFASWEGWSPTTAAYFCFVTLTTIGFGDYTPVKSFNGFELVE